MPSWELHGELGSLVTRAAFIAPGPDPFSRFVKWDSTVPFHPRGSRSSATVPDILPFPRKSKRRHTGATSLAKAGASHVAYAGALVEGPSRRASASNLPSIVERVFCERHCWRRLLRCHSRSPSIRQPATTLRPSPARGPSAIQPASLAGGPSTTARPDGAICNGSNRPVLSRSLSRSGGRRSGERRRVPAPLARLAPTNFPV